MSNNREITVQAIEQWRSQLPLSDLSASSKAFFSILHAIHEAKLSPEERFEISSILRPVLSYLCQTLQKFYFQQEILSDRQCTIADLVYALNMEMLKEYNLINAALAKNIFCNKKLLLTSTQNAMICCVKMIVNAYMQHRRPPPGIWLELHELFAFAQSKGIANKALNKVVEWHSHANTLTDIYKHCLLFILANPHRLRRDEMLNLLYALDSWTQYVVLQTSEGKNPPLFIVDLEIDSGPQYLALHFQPLKNYYYVLLNKVNEHLLKLLVIQQNGKNAIEREKFTEAELALSSKFIETLLNTWRHLNDRSAQREKGYGHVGVCLGISAIHWFISHHENVTLIDKKQESSLQKDETIHMDRLPSPNSAIEGKTSQYVCYDCEIIDQSEGGFCLKWITDIASQLQCGEIIALNKPGEPDQWQIATIRWLRHEKDNAIYFGVQLLSDAALAVKARLADAETLHSVPTLLLPERIENNKPITLVAPLLPFKSGNELEIEYNGVGYPVKLKHNYNPSPSYQEFELEFLGEAITFPTHSPLQEKDRFLSDNAP